MSDTLTTIKPTYNNPEERHERAIELYKEKLKTNYPKLYLAKYHHLTTHFKRLSFDRRYAFFIDLYKAADRYRSICVQKSVQCGVSDWLIIGAFDDAAKGLRVFYVVPNRDLRSSIVKDRIDTQIEVVPFYKQGIKEAIGKSESVGLKHFYKGLINFAGSKGKADFVSFQADVLLIDEVDKCDQNNLAMAPDRMDASEYKYDRRIGNPSVENWGINKVYRESTQGLWMIKCDKCNTHQKFDLFKNVVNQTSETSYDIISGDFNDPNFVCCKCHSVLDRFSKGEWVDTFVAERKGFQISQLFSANVTLHTLVDQLFKAIGNEVLMQLLFNSKLGLPYASSGSKITYSMLEAAANKTSYVISMNSITKAVDQKRLYVGIDVGKYFHVIVRQRLTNGQRKLVAIAKFYKTQELSTFLKSIKPAVMVIDEYPETKKVEDLKGELKKLYSCAYRKGQTFLDIRKKAETYKRERRVAIDRTFILDTVKQDFVRNLIILPSNAKDLGNPELEDYGEYYQNMIASTRIYDEDSSRFVWRESGPDHFFHAEAYCKMAEVLDDRVLDFYSEASKDYKSAEDKYEFEAMQKKEGTLIPTKKDGTVDTNKLNALSSDMFLKRLFNHTEDYLGKGVSSKKTRSDYDD